MPYDPPQAFKRPLELIRLGVLVLMMVILLGFWKVQILSYNRFLVLAEANQTRNMILYPLRGQILDRNGVVLADTRYLPLLVWQPQSPTSPEREFHRLIKRLALDEETGREWLDRARTLSPIYPEMLNFPLNLREISRLSFFQEYFPDLAIQNRPIRIYPFGPMTAHVIGYVGWMSEEDRKTFDPYKQWPANSFVGKTGLEKLYEPILHGTPGSTEYLVNHLGVRLREIDGARIPPQQGSSLRLTLDIVLQEIAYNVLKDFAASFVALDPRTGEILAMVNTPSFDPNAFIPFIRREQWTSLIKDPRHPLQSRATQGLYPPGSTIKPLYAVIALVRGWISPGHKVFCPGYARLYNHTYRCWQSGGHGYVSLNDAIVHSCDVYFYHLGVGRDIDDLSGELKIFGFGTPPSIDFTPVSGGLVPSRAWKQRVRREPWFPGETISVMIGQGPILVTPLQLALAYSMVFNRGTRFRPFLVASIVSQDGKNQLQRKPVIEAIYYPGHPAWDRVKKSVCKVVEEGTGRKAYSPDVRICGKTGTVELLSDPEKHDEETLEKYNYHAWFTGWFDNPHQPIVFALIIEHSGHGGDVAAPLAREIFETYVRKRMAKQSPTLSSEKAKVIETSAGELR